MTTKERVREHYEIAKTLVPEDLIIGCFLVGSQNYDMADEQSDVAKVSCVLILLFLQTIIDFHT